MPYALIDPNFNEGDEVCLSTVAANKEAAIELAETSKEVSLYSGYSEFPMPNGTRGRIDTLKQFGFRIAEVEITIKQNP